MAKKSKDSVVYSDEDMALKNKEISELSTKLLAIQTQLAQLEEKIAKDADNYTKFMTWKAQLDFTVFQIEERFWSTQRWRPSKA